MLRIDLLRHLPATHAPAPVRPASRPPRRAGRLLAGFALLLALAAGASWVLFPDWYTELPALPQAARPAAVDSAVRALEARAAADIRRSQDEAARLAIALEAALPDDSLSPVARAVLAPPDAFVLRGASTLKAFEALRDSLQGVSGVALGRAEARPAGGPGRVEFILSGTVAGDSLAPEVAGDVPSLAELERAWDGFLRAASDAGVDFAVLPAGAPTASGALQANPYRIIASCAPATLREFLAGPGVLGSPFGIRRITWENGPDGLAVSLDIMAFSRR